MKIALADLCQWLKEGEAKTERESKNRQKLLRNLMVCAAVPIKLILFISYCYKVLEQLIEILKHSGTSLSPLTYVAMIMFLIEPIIINQSNSKFRVPSSNYMQICQECYNILKQYLKGESRKNENYLARFIQFFTSQARANTRSLGL